MSHEIRTSRYVSCPAGTYPEPSPAAPVTLAMTDAAALAQPPAAPDALFDTPPAVTPAIPSTADPAATMALDADAARAAAEAAGPQPSAFEASAPALDTPESEGFAAEHIDSEAAHADSPAAPQGSLDATQPVPSEVAASAVATADLAHPSPKRRGRRPLAMIFGLLLGGAFGAIAGLALLASSNTGSLWTSMQDPVGLWNAVTDPMLRISAGLVAGGFAVLGLALGARRSRS